MANGLRRRQEDTHGFFDQPLCWRVNKTVADFEHSFEAASAQPTPQALDELREATDQLMRAAARVLLELSRPHPHGAERRGSAPD